MRKLITVAAVAALLGGCAAQVERQPNNQPPEALLRSATPPKLTCGTVERNGVTLLVLMEGGKEIDSAAYDRWGTASPEWIVILNKCYGSSQPSPKPS